MVLLLVVTQFRKNCTKTPLSQAAVARFSKRLYRGLGNDVLEGSIYVGDLFGSPMAQAMAINRHVVEPAAGRLSSKARRIRMAPETSAVLTGALSLSDWELAQCLRQGANHASIARVFRVTTDHVASVQAWLGHTP